MGVPLGNSPSMRDGTDARLYGRGRVGSGSRSPEFGNRMTLAGSRLSFVLSLVLVSAGCQSDDTSAKPPFVSVADGRGRC